MGFDLGDEQIAHPFLKLWRLPEQKERLLEDMAVFRSFDKTTAEGMKEKTLVADPDKLGRLDSIYSTGGTDIHADGAQKPDEEQNIFVQFRVGRDGGNGRGHLLLISLESRAV